MQKNANYYYRNSFTKYSRFETHEVKLGDIPVGSKYPVRVQTMTNTNTNDIEKTVEQSIRCIEAGASYIRITAQGVKEAENLKLIKEQLREKGYTNPIIADIHFNPKAAEVAALHVEKIRINPGNYVYKGASPTKMELTREEYAAELEKTRDLFVPLIRICQQHGTAMRIGSNHGSLSTRIMGKYGDTPEGMAEAAMEFLRICQDEDYPDVVVSMKSSNTRVMVQATRILVKKMQDENMSYPLHLGVTEAGEGEDGRIKSAIGIGALLADGIGDTIRVSLTEEPEAEIPVAKAIVDFFQQRETHDFILPVEQIPINPYEYTRRKTIAVNKLGGNNHPVVIIGAENYKAEDELKPDYLFASSAEQLNSFSEDLDIILPYEEWKKTNKNACYPLLDLKSYMDEEGVKETRFVTIKHGDLNLDVFERLVSDENLILVLNSDNTNAYAEMRAFLFELILRSCNIPVVFRRDYSDLEEENLSIKASCDLGPLFLDGLGDGIWIQGSENSHNTSKLSYAILQGSRVRVTKPEFISCPGCGRTLFDLVSTTKRIKAKLAHLTGLKIGIMGCIVNGPGEMADADYGYVGAGSGKVSLYKAKDCVKKNIPEENAMEELIQLIKDNGDWVAES